MSYTSNTYKLRSSGPFPIGGSFITHTFMAERNEIILHEATDTLLGSDDMAGLGGNYVSASYNGLAYVTQGGAQVFSGSEIKKPVYISESSMPGA